MQISPKDFEPLDFGDPSSGRPWDVSLSMRRLGLRILSLCAWPNDPTRRDQFEASYFGCVLGALQQSPPILDFSFCPTHLRQRLTTDLAARMERDFHTAGGLLSLASAPSLNALGNEIRKIGPAWLSVGAQMRIARSIAIHHGDIGSFGASLNKARFVLNACSAWTTTTLETNWTKFYPVAHFCAALQTFSRDTKLASWFVGGSPSFEFFQEGVPMLLSCARDFEAWATSFVSHAQDEPILSPHRIWSVGLIETPWKTVTPCPPLSGTLLDALGEYRAGKRNK